MTLSLRDILRQRYLDLSKGKSSISPMNTPLSGVISQTGFAFHRLLVVLFVIVLKFGSLMSVLLIYLSGIFV